MVGLSVCFDWIYGLVGRIPLIQVPTRMVRHTPQYRSQPTILDHTVVNYAVRYGRINVCSKNLMWVGHIALQYGTKRN